MTHHLIGRSLPDIALAATDGTDVPLADLNGQTVIYVYPRTSPPNGGVIPGWSDIVGAKGCTPQSCGFRDHYHDLMNAGACHVFGVSTQTPHYQSEVVDRLNLPYALLSDADLKLQKALGLCVFHAGGMTLLHRLTIIANDGLIEHVFDAIKDPAANAAAVLEYIKGR